MRLFTMTAIAVLLICALATTTAMAQGDSLPGVRQTIDDHFSALLAEEYRNADEYFTDAFRRAFKGDVARINEYYMARFEQAGRGYEVVEAELLADDGEETAIAVVEFSAINPDAPVTATQRVYYYLIREAVMPGAPGRDAEGKAWRIDIFDSFRFDSLAEARRRPYLYTGEAWPEDEGRELKSRQGLFRIQWALDAFYFDKGHYPFRLHGSDNRRDELIAGGYLSGAYPQCGFDDRPMTDADFIEKSSGDFTYIGVDADGNGECEDYWLLLHGKVPSHFYFVGRDTVYILGSRNGYSQADMANAFAEFWQAREGRELALTGAVEPMEPRGSLVPTIAQLTGEPAAESPVDIGTVPEPAELASEVSMLSVAYAAMVSSGVKAGAGHPEIFPEVVPEAAEAEQEAVAAAEPAPPAEVRPLKVYTYGF